MDPLTGVYSRATLEQRLSEEIERAQRYDLPFSIILLDLDHYKSINDAFGHLRGDQILVDFVTRLRTTIRKSDIFFRYGGDEFLLLLPNTPKDQAVQLAERLLEAVKSAPFGFNPPLSVTASMGVASAPGDGRTAETLFERADQRHYEAKRRGRSRVIGEDGQNEALLPYDDQARLLERDSALTTIQTYLRQLPIQRRGILTISGPPGSGKTRLLAEAGKIARLQGFEVINLHGSPALKNRIFGDLNDVYKQWDILPPPSVGEQVFGNALQSLVEEKGRSGLLFAVDNLHEVDWYTLEMLRQFILSSQPGIVLGLAFTADPSQARRLLASALPLQLSIELEALTLAGFKIWLRTLLQWEAPEELANWLYEQTGGLPSYLYHGLVDLIQRGLLERTQDGWTFNQELSHIRLSERLGFQIAPIPNTLPAPSTGFVGRQDEIQTAKDLIKRGRILTIVGPGGVGKTRLALQTGSELLEEFPQGVFWVPLAALAAADSLVTALAKALNFTFYNRDDPEIQLFNYLREKQLLLVVDNFEHLIDRAGLFSRLVEAAPGVKLLVTSIERLNLRGEAVLELHGMGFPKQLNTQSLESFPAVQLFVQSAQRANPGFTLSGDCRSAAVRICQLVEGLPLGIELATAWIRVLSCQEIAEEIEHSMDFLVANFQDVPERHHSLRAVFEHSWKLLPQPERKILSRLAVFRGGFDRDAVQEIAEASLFHLAVLLDKSLLTKSAPERYELHEILKQYAAEKLALDPEEYQLIHQRHAHYYTRLLEKQETALRSSRQKYALKKIGEELENVRCAWNWAAQHGELAWLNHSLESLYTFYTVRGLFAEGEQVFSQLEPSLSTHPSGEPLAQQLITRLTLRRAVFNQQLAQYEPSLRLFQTGLENARQLALEEEIAFGLLKLGTLHSDLSHYELARQHCQESLARFKQLAIPRGVGQALNQLGVIAYLQGNYPQAENYHQECLNLFRQLQDPWGLSSALINLGNVESELGDYNLSRQYYQESLKLCEELGAKSGQAASLNNIGDIARETRDFVTARLYLDQSAQIYEQIGDRLGLATALDNLGDLAYRQGNLESSKDLLEHSLELCRQSGNLPASTHPLIGLGLLATQRKDFPAAEDFFLQAIQLAMNNQAIPMVIEALTGLASLYHLIGETEAALQLTTIIQHHPGTLKQNREQASALRSQLLESLPEAVRGGPDSVLDRPIEEVVNEVLEKKCPSTP